MMQGACDIDISIRKLGNLCWMENLVPDLVEKVVNKEPFQSEWSKILRQGSGLDKRKPATFDYRRR